MSVFLLSFDILECTLSFVNTPNALLVLGIVQLWIQLECPQPFYVALEAEVCAAQSPVRVCRSSAVLDDSPLPQEILPSSTPCFEFTHERAQSVWNMFLAIPWSSREAGSSGLPVRYLLTAITGGTGTSARDSTRGNGTAHAYRRTLLHGW